MNTAQLAVIVTGAVGALGALGILSPILLSSRQQKHELKLARAERLHEQRLSIYRELGRFLEMQRTGVHRIEPMMTVGDPLASPPDPTDEQWAELHGSVAVAGSEAVQTALTEYQESLQDAKRVLNPMAKGEAVDLARFSDQVPVATWVCKTAIIADRLQRRPFVPDDDCRFFYEVRRPPQGWWIWLAGTQRAPVRI